MVWGINPIEPINPNQPNWPWHHCEYLSNNIPCTLLQFYLSIIAGDYYCENNSHCFQHFFDIMCLDIICIVACIALSYLITTGVLVPRGAGNQYPWYLGYLGYQTIQPLVRQSWVERMTNCWAERQTCKMTLTLRNIIWSTLLSNLHHGNHHRVRFVGHRPRFNFQDDKKQAFKYLYW